MHRPFPVGLLALSICCTAYITASAQDDYDICCVDVFGQSAGLTSRPQCQFDFGDVAPEIRCAAVELVGRGVALPDDIS